MITIDANHKSELLLGYAGESERTCVRFDLSALAEEYPDGVATLMVKRPGETAMYPALLIQDGDIYNWYVGVADTAYDGDGICQLTWQVGTVICKTHRWPTHVLESMTGETVDPPAPWESWVEDVLAAADEVKEAVRTVPETINAALEAAKESGEFDGYSPTVRTESITGGHRVIVTDVDGEHKFDVMDGTKGDTGNGIASIVLNPDYTLTINMTDDSHYTTESIRGETGKGISSVTLNQDYTLTITYTDGTNTTTASIRGATGATPDISIGTVETLAPGSQATASMTGTPERPVLNLGIPEGEQGVPGEVTLAELMTRAPVIFNHAEGSIAAFADGADGMPIRSLIAAIDPAQDGSGAASPDNVRSLITRTGLTLYRRGKNLLKNKLENGSAYGITWTVNYDGSVTLSGTAEENPQTPGSMAIYFNPSPTAYKQALGYGPVTLVSSMRASYNPQIAGLVFQTDAYVRNGTTDTYVGTVSRNALTVPAGEVYIRTSRIKINAGTVIPDGTVFYPQIEAGNAPTAYEAFSAETDIAVDWQAVAGAIYGGHRDLITGEMLIEWADVTLPNSYTIRTSGTGTGKYVLFNSGVTMLFNDNEIGVYAEKANGIPRANRGNPWEIYVTNATQLGMFVPSDATAESIAAAVGGSKAVVRLAEPIAVQAETLSLLSKYGNNSIYTDVGGVSVDYPADTKLYIDNALANIQALILENISDS